MADEPIGNDDGSVDDEGAEEPPIESQGVETKGTREPGVVEAQVVEAQVVAPNVRKPIPPKLIAAVVGLVVVGGAIAGLDVWVRGAEKSAYDDANQRHTLDGWQGYLDWAEDQGAWTNARTPIERHVAHATERRDVRRANGAAEASDWPALCGMLEEFDGGEPAFGAAQRALRERADTLIARSLREINSSALPTLLRGPVEAASAEVGQNHLCGVRGRVTFHVEASARLPEREIVLEAASAAIDVAFQPIVQELSTRNELIVFELSDSPGGESVMLEYTTNVEFVAGDTVRLSDGSPFSVPALLVDVRVHGPSTEMASHQIRYTLPATFGVELFAQSRSGKSAAELTTLAVQRLVGHVPARLRQVAGLTTFLTDGGVAAYSRCGGMDVIDRSMSVRANTARDGSDSLQFSCEDEIEPYYDGCCEDEDMNAVGRPEIGYRLVVNERSLVSLSADGAYGPIVGIFGECGPRSEELTCGDIGTTRAVLEPGVYAAYVGGMADEDAGAFELMASIQPTNAIPQACAAVTRELQAGVATSGSTAAATDNFSGDCGGAGGAEDTYRLSVTERSRVRCAVDGFDDWALHARSECEDFESELGCSSGRSLRFVAEAGTLFISVDGMTRRSKGDYELVCEVVPVPAVEGGANLCGAAQTFEVIAGQDSPVDVDLLSAPEQTPGLCLGTGPEAVYSFELAEDSYVQASSGSSAYIRFLDECARGATCTATSAARLDAGTHYLVAQGRRPLDFTRQTINVTSTPVAPLCEAAVLLRAGVTGGVVGASADPVIFGAECTPSNLMREALFRVRALHSMRIRLSAEGFGLSIHEGCGGRSLTCAPANVGTVEARLEPGEYTILVRGRAGAAFQLETEIERL